MSSRIAFAVHDASGLKTDLVTADFVVKKAGVPTSIEVISNNDGTYYFPISVSDIYTVTIKGTNQDEFENVYLPSDDIVRQTDVDDTTIEYSSGLKVKDGVFALADHEHDDDYLALRTHDVLDFEITDTEIKLKDRSTIDGTLLVKADSIATNLRTAADKVEVNAGKIETLESSLGITVSTSGRRRSIYVASRIAATGDGNVPGNAVAWTEVATSGVLKFACPAHFIEGDTTLILRLTVQIASGFSGQGGLVEVKTGDGATLTGSTVFVNTDSAEIEVAVDITGATKNRLHEIQIYLSTSDATKQVTASSYLAIDIY